MIDRTLVVGNKIFTTHRDRVLFLGAWAINQPRWLAEHPGSWRYIEDVLQEAALRSPSVEDATDPEAGPAEPTDLSSSPDFRKDGDEEDGVSLVDTPAGDCSPACQPTSLSPPVEATPTDGPTKAELSDSVTAVINESKGPKTETTLLGAKRRKRGRSRGRQLEKQKLSAEHSKAGRMRSPERMRIVLDSLAENRMLSLAAAKAGIHRKTLEYWINRSAAGDPGYDVEWQGLEWRFHEHCASAIAEADDRIVAAAWEMTMGRRIYKTDENGNRVEVGFRGPYTKKHGKMLRFLLEWLRPDKWGKNRKIEMPPHRGVLVIGRSPHDIPHKVSKGPAASVRARKWKAAWRMIHETED
jgi:hypothetical protein